MARDLLDSPDLCGQLLPGGCARPGASGYGPWPSIAPDGAELPATLPSGAPWPKISIVTASYNQGRYIEQTILSVKNQRYPNVEHIVIDGGSTDGTLGILERYRDSFAYVVSEKDNGQSHAINKGMSRVTGEIITWLNSDDMLAPGALAAVALAFHTSDADMVAGVCRLYSEGVLMEQHLASCPDGPLPLEDLLDLDACWNQGEFFYQPEVMFKRSLWERAGGHVDEDLHYSMDYELWVRFAEAGARIHVIGRPVAWFRLHPDQKTHATAKFLAELENVRKVYLERSGRRFYPRPLPVTPRRSLRIVLLNDHGFQYGAGIAHARLAQALAWAGHEVIPVSLVNNPLPEQASRPYTNSDVLHAVASHRPDFVVVGNVHSAKPDPELLAILAERFPTLCVLHDFWLITGRCAYPGDCTKYLTGCDEQCPTANEYPRLHPLEIPGAWKTKQALLRERSPILLANSRWTADYVRHALSTQPSGHKARVETFQLSFDLDTFQPLDKKVSRKLLGLPQDKFILLMTSEFADPRKGANLLLEALNQLRLPDLLLVSSSRSDPNPEHTERLDIRRIGYLEAADRLAIAYSASDLFVGASREETFGQTFIEAISCGTPALGFNTAGVKDAIRDGVTGHLIEGGTAADLAAAILDLYQDPKLRWNLGRWGRLFVENEWSPFSAYRQFFLALQRAGLLQDLDVPPKIRFSPQLPVVSQPRLASSGSHLEAHRLGAHQDPIPELNLPAHRWALGPATAFRIEAPVDGTQLIAIYYRNLRPNQAVAVDINGWPCGEFPLGETGYSRERVLVFEGNLFKGCNHVTLSFSEWGAPPSGGRPLAIIIIKVLLAGLTVLEPTIS